MGMCSKKHVALLKIYSIDSLPIILVHVRLLGSHALSYEQGHELVVDDHEPLRGLKLSFHDEF